MGKVSGEIGDWGAVVDVKVARSAKEIDSLEQMASYSSRRFGRSLTLART